MRTRWLTCGLLALVCACGGDDGGDGTESSDETADSDMTPDGRMMTTGFEKPLEVMRANLNNADVGAVDLGCLGTATNIVPTTTNVALTAKVVDFQKRTSGGDREPIEGALVTTFPGIAISDANPATSLADGTVAVTIPSGTQVFGFKVKKESTALDTLLINQFLEDATSPTQTYGEEVRLISKLTADTLPALIGIEEGRAPGTGMVAGAIRDCQGREISNFIATVSTTAGTATIPADQLSFYFSTAATPLPTVHSQNPDGSPSGLFLVLDVPPPASNRAFVQVWGYASQADLDADSLTLVAELEVPVIADTVVTGSYRPRRTGE